MIRSVRILAKGKLQSGHMQKMWAAAFACCLAMPQLAMAKSSEQVDRIFADLDKPDSAGCAVTVIHGNKTVYSRGYGIANLDHLVPISPRTVFDIGSTSKQFAAAAIALLALDGKLSLDDDIRKYVPEMPAYDRVITIRHLLHHTSGVRDFGTLFALSDIDDHDVVSYQDIVNIAARQTALNFSPGEEHLYSNTGYVLLAVITERVAAIPFGDFVEQRIFKPLGMKHSLIYEQSERIVPHRATGYAFDSNGQLQIDHYWNFALGGDGQVYTTVEDLALWDANFYEPAVGGSEFIDMMHTQGVLDSGEVIKYALGLYVGDYRGVETVSHGGAWGGFRAQFVRVPEHRFSTAVLCNLGTADPSKRVYQIIDLYLEKHLAPREDEVEVKTVEVPTAVLQDYVGQYLLDAGVMVDVVLKNDDLYMQLSDMPPVVLPARGKNLFYVAMANGLLSFQADSEGIYSGLRLEMGDTTMVGKRVEPFQPDAGLIDDLAGNYYSQDLGVLWRLEPKQDQLVLRIGVNTEFPLLFTAPDQFASDQFSGRIERDVDGDISTLVIDAGRTMGLKAVRQ